MKIFVTGATGVVGRRAVPLMVQAGHEVTAVARTPDKAAAMERSGARAVRVDLFDADGVRRAVAGHEAVVNLATHIPHSTTAMMLPWAWRENDRIRREGSAVLVDAALAAGATRFVQESFAPMYPDMRDEWIDEDVPPNPARYNRSTLDAERSAARFGHAGGTAVVLRYAGFYGPDASHIPDLIRFTKRGMMALPGKPEAYFSSISHDDAASAAVAALGVDGGIYNVSDDEPLRRRDFFAVIAAGLGVPAPRPQPVWMGRMMGSLGELLSRSLRMSNRKFREASGWAPRYRSVREGWPALLAEMRG
ncbi:NAD-dependent epimerase/dehydratase family protein [Longimicrobium sp.]|uniref:NAD-dependent epimerase/dehydratase family protein n=1 Tax=Longimicrobium sp. TaxID=2029185 RepID=UPI003B3AE61E